MLAPIIVDLWLNLITFPVTFPATRSYKNLVDSAQALVMACRKIGVDPEEPANRVRLPSLPPNGPSVSVGRSLTNSE